MSEEIKYVYIKRHPLFANLSEQILKDACTQLRVRSCSRGENIGYGDGHYSKVFLLVKGQIKISGIDDMDNELIKDILTAPDTFGDLSLDGQPAPDEYAEALTANTVVCYFHSADFKRLLQDHSALALNYANSVNKKLKKLEGRHSDLICRDAKSRLISFIRQWARTDGSRVGDKIVLNNYLTHSDIAGVIATSRQSVNTLLNELRDSGLLVYNRKQIQLNDLMSWN